MKKLIFIFALTVFILPGAFAHNDNKQMEKEHDTHHEEHGHDEPVKEITVSAAAKEHLKIEFKKIEGSSPWGLPKEALVQIKERTGLYKLHNEVIEFVDVEVIKSDKQTVTVRSKDLHAGDSVAVKGNQFIRIIESELNSEPAGHGH